MEDAPASASISTPPRALRPLELAKLVGAPAPEEAVRPPIAPPGVATLDLLAHTTSDEPVSEAPRAIRPLRHSAVRRRLH